MSLFDIFSSIIGFFFNLFSNLILKPLTPVIDHIFERLLIIVTSPLAVKRFSNLLLSIVDRITSEDHRDVTFKRVDKLICLIPMYLDRRESKRYLQKLGPAILSLPPILLADTNTILSKNCDILDLSVNYINATLNYITGTAQGTACVIKLLCAVQDVLKNLSATSSISFEPTSNPLTTILGIILAPDTLVPNYVFDNAINNPDLKEQLCHMLRDPCNKDLKESVLCMLQLAYEKHFDNTVDYDNNNTIDQVSDVNNNRAKKLTTQWIGRSNTFQESLPMLPAPPGRLPPSTMDSQETRLPTQVDSLHHM